MCPHRMGSILRVRTHHHIRSQARRTTHRRTAWEATRPHSMQALVTGHKSLSKGTISFFQLGVSSLS